MSIRLFGDRAREVPPLDEGGLATVKCKTMWNMLLICVEMLAGGLLTV